MKILQVVGLLIIVFLLTGCPPKPNPHPQAIDDYVSVLKNEEIRIEMLVNDRRVHNPEELDISIDTAPLHGELTLNSDFTYTYTPNEDFVGTDHFVYKIYRVDFEEELESHGLVNIIVKDGNIAPVAVDDQIVILKNTSENIFPLGNDINEDDGIEYVNIISVGNASHGTVILEDGYVYYKPDDHYSGNDEFTYTISDGFDESTATIYIQIKASNLKPMAYDDNVNISVNEEITINPLENDVDDDTLQIAHMTNPLHGTAEIINNEIVYTPNKDFQGTDRIEYTITDGLYSVQATIYIYVEAQN